MEGDSPGECTDCGEHFTYSKKRMETHTEYLRRHRCPKCGNFALKVRVLDEFTN